VQPGGVQQGSAIGFKLKTLPSIAGFVVKVTPTLSASHSTVGDAIM
jgi:hypothetical protein